MQLFIRFVIFTLLLRWSCLELESNETIGIYIDILLDNAGYPKSGDIPILNRKVFKGQRVLIREHPYIVSVRRQYAHYLVGSLLTKNVVISVAHPLANVPITELGIVVGENYADRGTAMSTVVIVILHQEFDPYTLKDDIAMLRFYEDVHYKFNVKSIALIALTTSLDGSKAFVTGWGRCDSTGSELCLSRSTKYFPDERFDPMLRSVTFTMSSSNYYCQGYKRHDVNLHPGMLCTGPAREEDPVCPCLGVPGAPLVLEARLAGLLSWGFGCGYGHDLPLVYTSIQHYSTWILHNIVKLRNIKKNNLTHLYRATKAYLLAEWMIKTRGITPFLHIRDDKSIEPLDVDSELIKLIGRVYDVRDFIGNGVYHIEKQNMFATLIYAENNKEKLMLIEKYKKKVPLLAFLPNNTLDEYSWITVVEETDFLKGNHT